MATADKLVARFTEEGGNAGVNSLALCKRSYLGYDRVVSLTSLLVAQKKKTTHKLHGFKKMHRYFKGTGIFVTGFLLFFSYQLSDI